jgi:hypothetical protein
MPVPLPNDFQMYEFTAQEQIESAKLNQSQQLFIQNIAGQVAHQIINVMITQNLDETKRQIAYLTGQFQILKYILEMSNTAYAGNTVDQPIPSANLE